MIFFLFHSCLKNNALLAYLGLENPELQEKNKKSEMIIKIDEILIFTIYLDFSIF
jgi:hypothetical protein